MKPTIISLFFFLVLFSSCKKEECNDFAGLIHTVDHTYGTYHRFYTYSYDENRRVIRRESSEQVFENTYKPDTILVNMFYQGTLEVTSTYFLNGYSMIDSVSTIHPLTMDAYYYKHLYDGEYISSIKYYAEDLLLHWTYYYNYSNENLAFINEISSDGDTLSKLQYEYYTDKENMIDPSFPFQSYGGKPSKNLVKRRVEIHYTDIRVYDYSYTYDSEGRIQTQTVSTANQPDAVDVYTYY
jgi:YD repeat-containing protein